MKITGKVIIRKCTVQIDHKLSVGNRVPRDEIQQEGVDLLHTLAVMLIDERRHAADDVWYVGHDLIPDVPGLKVGLDQDHCH